MKLNIANPVTGKVKIVDCDDDQKLLPFFEKRMAAEVPGDSLGQEFAGYIFRITGGNDKQGFPMLQGVLTQQRVRLLFKKGMKCFRERRKGSRKRKSVRGCIVGPDLSVLSLVVVKKGENDIPGLTDEDLPRRLGPKRVSKIRQLFGLDKEDDVRKFVVRREVTTKNGKKKSKAPKIQRLITSVRLQRKRHIRNSAIRKLKENQEAVKQYKALIQERRVEKRAALAAKKKGDKAEKA
jgi:small subunit ribosomal protein S6e